MEERLLDHGFWVGVGTLIFLGVLVWKKVPGMVTAMLDARALTISAELDEARRLREEAEGVLAQYVAKGAQAEAEVAEIVANAKADAERYKREAEAQIAQQIERRTKQAEDKITQAEAQAVADVRKHAADVAINAAGKIIAARMDDARSKALVQESLRALPDTLN